MGSGLRDLADELDVSYERSDDGQNFRLCASDDYGETTCLDADGPVDVTATE